SIADQTAYEDTPVAPVPFTVNDAETAATNLMVIGRSSNLELVPNYNIAFDGDGTNRTVVVTPLTNQSGTTTITVTVTDGDGDTATASFLLTVKAVNDPPTISSIADQSTDEDTPTPAIPFTISDVETNADRLMVAGSSSNQGLVPDANIAFGGSGSDRTVTIRPVTSQFGTTTITITVSDGDGGAASSSFLLTVNAVNHSLTISNVPDQTTNEDTPTPAIPFTISDVETNADRLMVTGRSSNKVLVPDANIAFRRIG